MKRRVIDLSVLVRNAQHMPVDAARAIVMVKGDGYGLGVEGVVRALEELRPGPWGYGVTSLEEGIDVRCLTMRPVVVFTPPSDRNSRAEYFAHRLTAVMERPSLAQMWDCPFHIEVDTGLHRSGVPDTDHDAIAWMCTPFAEGIFTHNPTDPWSRMRFKKVLDHLHDSGASVRPLLVHDVSSTQLWNAPAIPTPLARKAELVRPGIYLYGSQATVPLTVRREERACQVLSVFASVVSVRRVAEGESVGYDRTCEAMMDCTVATLDLGYVDGMPRTFLAGFPGVHLAGGVRCPIFGNTSMDYTTVRVPEGTNVSIGDVVLVLGTSPDHGTIGLDQFADRAGLLPEEVLARFGQARRFQTTFHFPSKGVTQ